MALNKLANGHFGLQSDQITYIALDDFDAAGVSVPFPTGDVDTVSGTGTFAASLGFAISTFPAGSSNAGATALQCTPLVLESDASNGGGGIGIAITDGSGQPMNAATQAMLFDIVQDVTPVSVGLDSSVTATVSQTAPTAPGP